MKRRLLKEDLVKLEKIVEDAHQTDKESMEQIAEIIPRIHSVLNESVDDKGRQDIIDQLKKDVVRFESEHIVVTDILNRIITTLVSLGI